MSTASPPPQVAALLPEARATIDRVARSFSLAARLLPRSVRGDVDLLYLVLRSLDDLVDVEVGAGGTERSEAQRRIAAIEAWARGRDATTAAEGSKSEDAMNDRELMILADIARRHPNFPRDAVTDFLAGMRTDLAPTDFVSDEDHVRYCYQVAGTVGRMMAAILGVLPGSEREADAAARALGEAMQRTNILRDIDEDLAAGRVYLSNEALRHGGLDPAARSGPASLRDGDRRRLLIDQIARADEAYERGVRGIVFLRNGRRSIAAAAALYREILRQIERDGFGVRRPHRPVVGRLRKARAIAGALLATPRSAAGSRLSSD